MNKANNKTQKKNRPVKRKAKKKGSGSKFILVGAVLLTVAVIILAGIAFSSDKVIDDGKLSSENSELLSTVSENEMGFPVSFSNASEYKSNCFLYLLITTSLFSLLTKSVL